MRIPNLHNRQKNLFPCNWELQGTECELGHKGAVKKEKLIISAFKAFWLSLLIMYPILGHLPFVKTGWLDMLVFKYLIIEPGWGKKSWFVSSKQINNNFYYLQKPKAEANNNYWSVRHWQITVFCDNRVQ